LASLAWTACAIDVASARGHPVPAVVGAAVLRAPRGGTGGGTAAAHDHRSARITTRRSRRARQVRDQHCRPFFDSFANRLPALDYPVLQGYSADCRDRAGRRRFLGCDSHPPLGERRDTPGWFTRCFNPLC